MRDAALGEILSIAKHPVRLEDEAEYRTVGVYSFGRGLFARPPVLGSEVSYPTYYRIHEGQFVYSKLFAWEGALATVPEAFDGYFVSQEFPTFDVDRSKVLPEFIRLLTTWPELWDRVKMGESGMGGRRKRVHPDKLMTVVVPLPDLAMQNRIVDLVCSLDHAAAESSRLIDTSMLAGSAIINELTPTFLGSPRVELGTIGEVVGGLTKDSKRQHEDFREVPYLRVANVQRGMLDLTKVATIRAPASAISKLELRVGDVLFNEGGDRDKLGRGWVWNAEIPDCIHQNHVFRARITDPSYDPYFVSIWGNSRFGQEWFENMGSQTTNLASINMRTLRSFPIPALPRADQEEVVETFLSFRSVSQAARTQTATLLTLRSAVLNGLLAGDHGIPDSYDALLEHA